MLSTNKPWKLVNNYDDRGKLIFCSLVDITGLTIGELYLSHDKTGQITEEDHFTLNLIKSAPQMYETLTLVKSWMESTGSGFDMLGYVNNAILEAQGALPKKQPEELL